jgi:hypothetical protein
MSRFTHRALLALLLLSTSCVEPGRGAPDAAPLAPDPGAATLELRAVDPSGDTLAVDLHFSRGERSEAPRMMEVHLRLRHLRFLGSEPLSAALAADKQVVVQEQDGTLRAVLFATGNTSRLASGPLVRFDLAPDPEGTEGRVEILDQRPIFAPPESDRGVTLGAPLDLGGVK